MVATGSADGSACTHMPADVGWPQLGGPGSLWSTQGCLFLQQIGASIFSRCWQRGKKASRKKHTGPHEVRTDSLPLPSHSVGARKSKG